MSNRLSPVVRLLIAITSACLSYFYQLPLIVFAGIIWLLWLWIRMPTWKERGLSSLGLAVIVLGWWVIKLDRVFGAKIEGTHFPGEANYWSDLIKLSLYGGAGLILTGLVLLAGVDYWGRLASVSISAAKNQITTDSKTDSKYVWPPAPKPPE